MSLAGYQEMACECGGKHFYPTSTISWHESHGTAAKPAGWVCLKCQKHTDLGKMIANMRQKAREAKIKELQAEV